MNSRAICRLAIACLLVSAWAIAQDPTKVASKEYRLAFENEHVQVVYIHYAPHAKSVMHDHPGGVVVNVTDGHLRFTDPEGKTTEIAAKRGEARWFKPLKHQVENLADTAYEAVYIGVKGLTSISGLNGLSDTDRALVAAFVPAKNRLLLQPTADPPNTKSIVKE